MLTTKDLHTYLRDNKQDSFLLSEEGSEESTDHQDVDDEFTNKKSA